MTDQTKHGILEVQTKNKHKRFVEQQNKIEKFRERRYKAIDRLSRKRGWPFSDNNPMFEDVFTLLPKTKATNSREYKKERKQYEEMVLYNAIRNKLHV